MLLITHKAARLFYFKISHAMKRRHWQHGSQARYFSGDAFNPALPEVLQGQATVIEENTV